MKRELYKLSRNIASAVLFFAVIGCFFAVTLVYLLSVDVKADYSLGLVPEYGSKAELEKNIEDLKTSLAEAEIKGIPVNTIETIKRQIRYSEYINSHYVPYESVTSTAFPMYANDLVPLCGTGMSVAWVASHVVAMVAALILINSEYIGGVHRAFYSGQSDRRRIIIPKLKTVLLLSVGTALVLPVLSFLIGLPFGVHRRYLFAGLEHDILILNWGAYLLLNYITLAVHAVMASFAVCGISMLINNIFVAGAVSAVVVIALPVAAQSFGLNVLTAAFLPSFDTVADIWVTLLCKTALAACCAALFAAGLVVHKKRDL